MWRCIRGNQAMALAIQPMHQYRPTAHGEVNLFDLASKTKDRAQEHKRQLKDKATKVAKKAKDAKNSFKKKLFDVIFKIILFALPKLRHFTNASLLLLLTTGTRTTLLTCSSNNQDPLPIWTHPHPQLYCICIAGNL